MIEETARVIELTIEAKDGRKSMAFEPRQLVIAGWTGRDVAVLNAHIDELAALGVAPPKSVPIFYRVSADLLTPHGRVQMVGREASGEAEAVLWKHDGALFVGIGSDHTDRALETVGITLSKQLCAKPISTTVWPWQEVAAHWDELILRSTLPRSGETNQAAPRSGETYQEGSVGGLRRPDDLLALYEEREGPVGDGTVMFCGTLPVHGGIRFADEMALELEDPVLRRSLRHSYKVEPLPIAEA
jgi:hypothetical protein